jgi:pyruvate dehydrogenase E2 component (dihydrolipoamide acetyltransferase)
MATELKVPKLGMDMEEANILRWLVEEGVEVEKGDPVLEIDTDKTSFEIEANADGIIRGLKGEAGETVLVGATLAYIAGPGEEIREAEEEDTPSVGDGTPETREDGVLPARGTAQEVTEVEPETPDHRNGRRRVRASPAARKAAAERGLPIETVAGSGPNGRIYLSDVLQASVQPQAPLEEVHAGQTGESDEETASGMVTPAAPFEPSGETLRREPISRVRRLGAERTAKSFAEVPHFYLTRDLEVDRLLELRERLKAKMEPAPSLTELFALAVARTLKDHPRLNARYVVGGEVELNPRVNLGIAVATDEGLVVPVLKGTDTLPLRGLVPAAKDLVQRAREGRLGPDDLSGGTFTISNLGMMQIDTFDAIINTPQAAILALGRVRTVPEWRDGEWLPQHVISATLSIDHRVADGADGARFLQDLQEALVDWELLL